MRPLAILVGITAVALVASCSALTNAIQTIATSNPESEIRTVRTRSNVAIAAHDLETVVATLTPDVVVTGGNGGVTLSRDSVRSNFRRYFADTTFIDYLRTPDSIAVSTARPALAAERGHWMGRYRTAAGIEDIGGTYMAMWRRTNEGWRIRSELFVSLTCHGPRMCAP